MHTHTHTHTYLCVPVFVCVCEYMLVTVYTNTLIHTALAIAKGCREQQHETQADIGTRHAM